MQKNEKPIVLSPRNWQQSLTSQGTLQRCLQIQVNPRLHREVEGWMTNFLVSEVDLKGRLEGEK